MDPDIKPSPTYPTLSVSETDRPNRVLIAYTNISAVLQFIINRTVDSINGSDNQTSSSLILPPSSSSTDWWISGYPSGYSWPLIIIVSILITIVIIIIIIGNFLVIWAISHDRNLKVTQNWFIASLACADLLIGLLILPFSLTNELLGYWPFGVILCEIYKALDVLLCTASIMSLCMISLDRYWSITRAVTYARQRTNKRAMIMIFTVWFISAVVCIPPLIGWNKPTEEKEWPMCMLSEDIGYVLYSASGSFFIPAFIMVFVYMKIYKAAKKRARGHAVRKIPNDNITVDQSTNNKNNCIEMTFTEPCQHHNNNGNCDTISVETTERTLAVKSNTTDDDTAYSTVAETVDNFTTSEDELKVRQLREPLNDKGHKTSDQEHRRLLSTTDSESNRETIRYRPTFQCSTYNTSQDYATDSDIDELEIADECNVTPKVDSKTNKLAKRNGKSENTSHQQFAIVEIRANGTSSITDNNAKKSKYQKCSLFSFCTKCCSKSQRNDGKSMVTKQGSEYSKCTDLQSNERQKKKLAKARERRATVVLGIVMAAFILCWLPFFSLYMASAFCSDCIHPIVFKVFFWIGYFNSVINPFIYTVFNREFRRAFQKIIFGRKSGRR